MNANTKAALCLLGFIGLLVCLTVLAGLALYYDLELESQRRVNEILAPRVQLMLGLGVLVTGALGLAFVIAYNRYVRGALKVAEAMHIMLKANPGHRIDPVGPPELALLARTANELAEHSQALARGLETKVAQAKSSVEEEKHRLAALMSELSQGVLVCNIDGRILLYNESARQALGVSANGHGPGPASRLAHRSRPLHLRGRRSQSAGPRAGNGGVAAREKRGRSQRAIRHHDPRRPTDPRADGAGPRRGRSRPRTLCCVPPTLSAPSVRRSRDSS